MRPRLHALLDRGVQSAVTLVSAPAARQDDASRRLGPHHHRSALDPLGRARRGRQQAGALPRSISTALGELLVPPAPTRRLRGRRIPPGAWPTLLNSIEHVPTARPRPRRRASPPRRPCSAISHLVRLASASCSPRDPTRLPLERYRLWGRLTDVRAADLAMTSEETRAVLGESAQTRDADVEARAGRGWPAAIRLAAISLRSAEDPRRFLADFNADNRAISDYLLTEVVGTQPPDLRLFLLRTSIADRLTPELATRLTGRFDAGAVLADLVRSELFVRASDQDPPVYRYPLFRSFLRAQLALERPQEGDDLAHRMERP